LLTKQPFAPGEFFREEASRLKKPTFSRDMVQVRHYIHKRLVKPVQKLTGINTREEKNRVLAMFREG
jgi:hypothetical protein